jgi:hypothetical protein
MDELKEMTTYKLNKAFTVKGYRITKIKGEIGLATQHYIPKSRLIGRKEDLQILNDKIYLIVEILKERGIIKIREKGKKRRKRRKSNNFYYDKTCLTYYSRQR